MLGFLASEGERKKKKKKKELFRLVCYTGTVHTKPLGQDHSSRGNRNFISHDVQLVVLDFVYCFANINRTSISLQGYLGYL